VGTVGVVSAASTFAERVAPYQKLAFYAFDGSPHLTPIAGFVLGRYDVTPRGEAEEPAREIPPPCACIRSRASPWGRYL